MKILIVATSAIYFLWGIATYAQGPSTSVNASSRGPVGTDGSWSPERLKEARPRELPRADEPWGAEVLNAPTQEKILSAPGRGPTIHVPPNNTKLYEPLESDSPPDAQMDAPVLNSVGTTSAYFTSSRVVPAPAAQNAAPLRQSGKLFYSDSGGLDWLCSASVIRPRLIITAGHCVYDASTKRWNTDFLFIPAFHNGAAPYGQWSGQYAITTTAWMKGGGAVPNRGDFALIEMKDNASGQKIGAITGYYGYRTNSLYPNHVTMIGYPAGFDSGNWMHRVDAQSFRLTSTNTVEYGSDMGGGSSGGPWLMNFGVISSGQSLTPSGVNYVVGVTSYGPVDTALRYQGAAILDSQFTNTSKSGILDVACAHRAGNC